MCKKLNEGISLITLLDINTFQIGQEWSTLSHDNQRNLWFKWPLTTDDTPAALAQATEVHIILRLSGVDKAMAFYS